MSRLRASSPAWWIAVAGLLSGEAASAQTVPSPYRFIEGTHSSGVIVGFAQENRGEIGIGPGGGLLFGGRYAIELRGPLALEVTGYLLPTDRVVFDAVSGRGLIELGTTDMTVAALEGRLRFTLTGARTWHGIAPFLSLGGGLVGNFSEPSPLEVGLLSTERVTFGPSFVGTMGGGVRWLPTEKLEFRSDASLSIWKVGTPVGFNEVDELLGGLPDQQWVGVSTVVMGVLYRF